MKSILLTALLCLGGAASANTFYLGEQTASAPNGTVLSVTPLFVERNEDRAAGRIVERSIEVKPAKCLDIHTATLSVSGNHFTLTEDTGAVTGGGDYFGPAWNWHSFRATFIHKSGTRIEDVNYLMDPSVLTAHKTIIDPTGKEMLQLHVSVHQVPERLFRNLTAAIPRCP